MASFRTAGLTKDFGDLQAVNEIDLDLLEGGVAQPPSQDRQTTHDHPGRLRAMIEAHQLTKRYGDKTAVDAISFTIAPGTGTVNGKPYGQHHPPLREVGALLDARAVRPGRSARSHLRTMAATHTVKASRVDEVIEMTGLAAVANKRAGSFSLGVGQRPGIAATLLQTLRSVE